MQHRYSRKLLDLWIFRWILPIFPILLTFIAYTFYKDGAHQKEGEYQLVGLITFLFLYTLFALFPVVCVLLDFFGKQKSIFQNGALIVRKYFLGILFSSKAYDVSQYYDIRAEEVLRGRILRGRQDDMMYHKSGGSQFVDTRYITTYYLTHRKKLDGNLKLETLPGTKDRARLKEMSKDLGLDYTSSEAEYIPVEYEIEENKMPKSPFKMKVKGDRRIFVNRTPRYIFRLLSPIIFAATIFAVFKYGAYAYPMLIPIGLLLIVRLIKDSFIVSKAEIKGDAGLLGIQQNSFSVNVEAIDRIEMHLLDKDLSSGHYRLHLVTVDGQIIKLPAGIESKAVLPGISSFGKHEAIWLKKLIENRMKK